MGGGGARRQGLAGEHRELGGSGRPRGAHDEAEGGGQVRHVAGHGRGVG